MNKPVLPLVLLLLGCSRAPTPPPSRIPVLEHQLTLAHPQAEEAFARYKPTVTGAIDGPAAVEILRQLPGVANVEVLVKVDQPAHRLIHLRDWHVVPPDVAGQANVKEDELRLEAELFQLEQTALLRCLVKHHGLKRVLAEGLTNEGMANYRDIVAAFRKTQGRLDGLKTQRDALKDLPAELDYQIESLARAFSAELTGYGAATRMLLADGIEVLPLNDRELLEAALPGPDGVSSATLAAREAEQVRRALASSPVSLVILGGDHDLSEAIKKAGGTEYVRVTTSRYLEFAGP